MRCNTPLPDQLQSHTTPPPPCPAALIGKDPDFFVYTTVTGGKTYVMDWWAFAITLAMTAFVSIGAKVGGGVVAQDCPEPLGWVRMLGPGLPLWGK